MTRLALIAAALGALAAPGVADPASPSPETAPSHDWAVGVMLGGFAHPSGDLGIPAAGTHLAPSLYVHRAFRDHLQLAAGIGLPSAMGVAVWAGVQPYIQLWARASGSPRLEVYADPAAQLGFTGPDYYAHRDNEFVGYRYAASGPLTVALRLPAGVRLRWWHDRFETAFEVLDVVGITPTLHNIVSLQLGVGVRFR
jgi:hypothetical protein